MSLQRVHRGPCVRTKQSLITTHLMRTIMSFPLNCFTSSLATKALAASSDSKTAKMEPCKEQWHYTPRPPTWKSETRSYKAFHQVNTEADFHLILSIKKSQLLWGILLAGFLATGTISQPKSNRHTFRCHKEQYTRLLLLAIYPKRCIWSFNSVSAIWFCFNQ